MKVKEDNREAVRYGSLEQVNSVTVDERSFPRGRFFLYVCKFYFISCILRVASLNADEIEQLQVCVCKCFLHFWQGLKALPGLTLPYISAAALRIVFSDFMTKIIEQWVMPASAWFPRLGGDRSPSWLFSSSTLLFCSFRDRNRRVRARRCVRY